MSTATQDATEELLRICEQLPEAKLAEVRDFARSLLGRDEALAADNAAGLATTDEDIEVMRQSMKDVEMGNCREASEFFRELEAKLLVMKADRERAAK